MAETVAERVSVLEVKVENINEKIDDVKNDICQNHTSLLEALKAMREESTKQHGELAGKVKDLQSIKDKWIRWALVGLAFAAGAGWVGHPNVASLLKFVGL